MRRERNKTGSGKERVGESVKETEKRERGER